MKKGKLLLLGLVTGVVNGLLGAGGGMILVPMLSRCKLEEKQRHATSVAIILPITLVSTILYYLYGNLPIGSALRYIPFGIVGALLGGYLLPRIGGVWIRRAFGAMVLFFALRMLF